MSLQTNTEDTMKLDDSGIVDTQPTPVLSGQQTQEQWETEFESEFGAFAILGSAGRFYNGAFANEARIKKAQQFIYNLLSSSRTELLKELKGKAE
ncbi:MAG: hypothetical protein AAB907_00050, partial [Patescibacteria group bacterium]